VKIDILTLFPGICSGPLDESIIRRAREAGIAEIRAHDLRDWATGKHRQADDAPYGGGPGMVMKIEPIFRALSDLRSDDATVLYLSPQGPRFDRAKARALACEKHLILLCGHYEGIDQRVIDHLVDAEISIGDYVLTNGALAACVVVDAVVRLLPGALGDEESAAQDSFEGGLLDCPHYTRPEEFNGWPVPPVLLSGNHAEIARWRRECAVRKTREVRPDLSGPAG